MFNAIARNKYIWLIGLTFLVAAIETDLYLPSFPDMMVFFHANEQMIQRLLSWNFIAVCLSGPIYGPLSDIIGRKKPLIAALGLFFIGSVLTLFAKHIEGMLVGRVLQGLGAGGCFTLGSTLIYDVYHEEKATKVVNDLNCFVPTIMAGAPIAGGYLNLHYGFRSNFIVIALFVAVSLGVCLFALEESLPKEKRSPANLRKILGDFATAFKSFPFWLPTLMVGFIFSGYLTYVSYSAILFVNHLGVSPKIFPLYQATTLLAFVSASLSANRMINAVGVARMKRYGLILLTTGGLCFIATSALWPNHYNLFHGMMLVYSFGAGWLIGPFFTESMETLPDIKGVTASLVTSFRLLFAAGIVGLSGWLFDATIAPLTYIFVALFTLGFLIMLKNGR